MEYRTLEAVYLEGNMRAVFGHMHSQPWLFSFLVMLLYVIVWVGQESHTDEMAHFSSFRHLHSSCSAQNRMWQ